MGNQFCKAPGADVAKLQGSRSRLLQLSETCPASRDVSRVPPLPKLLVVLREGPFPPTLLTLRPSQEQVGYF